MISFNENLPGFKVKGKAKRKAWLKALAEAEKYKILELSYIFLSDEALLEYNRKYLDHDTYTDIITFDNSDYEGEIEGDVFVSVERIKENAGEFGVDFENELNRILAHGLLHLCGYDDKTEAGQQTMRAKEQFYLEIY